MGVFEGNKEITHKSDQRYVVRGKGMGQRQIQKDQSKNTSSVGSQMRRANEKKHQQSIENILEENMNHLNNSDLILIHAPGINEDILFDQGQALNHFKKEDKIKSICVPQMGKKANYTEVKKIYDEVTKMYIFDDIGN